MALVTLSTECDSLLQAAMRPPTFVFFVNDAKLFSETYRRYMEKQLRKDAGFSGTPIRLLWRSRRKMERNEGKYKPFPLSLFEMNSLTSLMTC